MISIRRLLSVMLAIILVSLSSPILSQAAPASRVKGTGLKSTTRVVLITTTGKKSVKMRAPSIGAGDALVLAAGDIADCTSRGDYGTAAIIASYPDAVVLTLGDNAYTKGTPQQFARCYAPAWGKFLNRTHPSPGNHDYYTSNAAGYFGYFGQAAGDPNKGYYSFNLGAWHIISLNSDCQFIGDCKRGSPEETWLRADLAAHPNACTLAYWHHPMFSSGTEGSSPWMRTIWTDLYRGGVDVVLNGHDHDYERFAPQDANGAYDPVRGITEFIVGTGGKSHIPFRKKILANSLVRDNISFGVLALALRPDGYSWQFIPSTGSLADAGSARCH